MEESFFRDKNIVLYSSAVILFSLFLVVNTSVFVGITVLGSLATGLLSPHLIFRDKKELPNLLSIFSTSTNEASSRQLPRSCSICDEDRCSRQHDASIFNSSSQAHVHFTVPQSVDQALEELLNLILDHHVYSWYKEISVHDQFADEIRHLIRYATASICSRMSKVELSDLILNSLIPCGISHLEAYVASQEKSGTITKDEMEVKVMQLLSTRNELHPALQSRQDEANYLRAVVKAVYPFLVPVSFQQSTLTKTFIEELLGRYLILQGLDLLADPDTVNFLFLLLLDDAESRSPEHTTTAEESPVLLLKAFSSVNTHSRNSALRSNLSSVLKDQSLLYLFHNFLKAEGAINILSFCLAVEDFNRHILNPELTEDQLQTLYVDALELYHTYMTPTAVYKIHFQPEIVSEIKQIVHGDVSDIVKLRTTRPLFQAYEYGYNLLEREYLPAFMNGCSYYGHLCGQINSQNLQKNQNRDVDSVTSPILSGALVGKKVVRRVGSGLASLGRQMALKPSVINGDEDVLSDVDEASEVSSYLMSEESGTPRNCLEGFTHTFRDLSAWRVSIPGMEQSVDEDGKMEFLFLVDVKRIDVTGDNADELHWVVERRYHEFYVLESKLTEFHGELIDTCLPPRRSFFASKGSSFMHSRRQIFEEFLQKLLRKPFLKNSQLLFLFFKSHDEFTASFLPDFSLGRLLKEVPRKLMKEKGQNLDSFISSFIDSASYKSSVSQLSIEEVTPGVINPSVKDLLPEEDFKLKQGTLYKDNANGLFTHESGAQLHQGLETPHKIILTGVVEYILYVALRVYKLSLSWLRFSMPFKVLLGNTFDAAVSWYLRRKLSEYFAPSMMVKQIQVTRDVLFSNTLPPRSHSDILKREGELKERLDNIIPKWLRRMVADEEMLRKGNHHLVDLFQHPILNKQLSYVLLDSILKEVFPDLNTKIHGTYSG